MDEVMEVDEFAWIKELKVKNKTDLDELREALESVNRYKTLKDLNKGENLRDNLDAISFFIRTNTANLNPAEIRRIAFHIRKLWFLKGTESKKLTETYTEFLRELIEEFLNAILTENELEKAQDQEGRCVFLLALFSHFYDDSTIYGICKYDKLFLTKLMARLMEQTQRMVCQNEVEPENYYRLIYLMDKMMVNWKDAYTEATARQYDMDLLSDIRNTLVLLSESCKNHYKLVSLAMCTIVGNIAQIETIHAASKD